ncbi:MAG: aconitase family protein, partial [Tistlia sp.]
ILATGRIWVQVPETVRVELLGRCPAGVSARDIVLATMRQVDADLADYRVIEFGGEGLASLSVPERMTLCGLCIDMGVKSAVAEVDRRCLDHLAEIGVSGAEPLASDPGCTYAARIELDISTLAPQVSIPPSPTHVRGVSELPHTPVQHAYIGSCASGTLAELSAAADLLEGRQVHPGVQLLVIPATRRVYQQAMEQGLLARLSRAGAAISPPTCGPCFGGLAQLAAGETRISTSTRNDPGRMGAQDAQIYLASALTVAASALAGHIADPRDYLRKGEA